VANTTFTQKILSFEFSLAEGSATAGAANTATVTTAAPKGAHSGIRASTRVQINGGDSSSGRLDAVIYGLPLSLMNQLTTLGTQLNSQGQNTVTMMAGDAVNGMSMAFTGHIFDASPDGNAPPSLAFRFYALADHIWKMQPAAPTSVKGTGDVATIMGNLAKSMGLTLENSNVNVKISNPYLWGSPRVQAQQLAHMAGVQVLVDKGKLAIWPAGGSRQGAALMVSKTTGMKGTPRLSSAQVAVEVVYTPAIQFGGQMKIQSEEVAAANGTWNIKNVVLDLESFMPRGKWFATLTGINPQSPQQVGN
jgi:hypothetical protein